jgi:glycosyltransferase involved in cell wall biosynthesis
MHKRVVVILSGEAAWQALRDTLRRLRDEGYEVYKLGVAPANGLDLLPAALERADEELGPCAGRLVVMTHRRDWILAWARAYPELVDDYVWAPEPVREEGDDVRVAALASLAGLEADAARVHVAVDWANYHLAIGILARHPSLFRPYAAMDHTATRPRRISPRSFSLSSARAVPAPAAAEAGRAPVFVDSAPPAVTAASLRAHPWLCAFAVAAVERQANLEPDVARAVQQLLSSLTGSEAQALAVALGEHVAHEQICACLRRIKDEPNGDGLEALMRAVAGPDEVAARSYPVLASTPGFKGFFGTRAYPRLPADRERAIVQIAGHLASGPAFDPAPPRSDRVAFLLGQIKSAGHAPTNNLRAYLAHLAVSAPHLKCAVVATDDLTPSPFEILPENTISSEGSLCFADEHVRLMPGVPIHYSDTARSRGWRVRDDLDALSRFQPGVVVAFGAETSLLRPLIFPHYPVLSLSMGGPPGIGFCDVYAGPNDPRDVEQMYDESGLARPREIRQHRYGMDLPLPKRVMSRTELGLSDEDFVVCTVGNRLDGEIDSSFVDLMEAFLNQRPESRWLIVGGNELAAVRSREPVWQRVVHVAYEADLPALYERCDVFANPFRRGGGHSVALAMDRAVPVVSLDTSNDAMMMLGAGRGVANAAAYLAALTRLREDADRRAAVGIAAQAHIREFVSWNRAMRELSALLELTRSTFYKRTAKAVAEVA